MESDAGSRGESDLLMALVDTQNQRGINNTSLCIYLGMESIQYTDFGDNELLFCVLRLFTHYTLSFTTAKLPFSPRVDVT